MQKLSTVLMVVFFGSSLLFAGKESEHFQPLPAKAPVPKDNPMSAEKVELGKQLFFDPRLSKDGTVSCNSCHDVMGSGTDSKAFSTGVGGKLGGRSAPTVWNAAFQSVQFWDGRAKNLEEQAKGPLTNPIEMAMGTHDFVMGRIKKVPGYVSQFDKVFGKNAVTIENVSKAIAAFERTLITPNAPLDRYLKGDKKAMTAQAVRGMNLVIELNCVQCHNGKNLSGPELPQGEANWQKFPLIPDEEYTKKYNLLADKGRAEVTKDPEHEHYYRVPTWRNVALTAPYFHNGAVKNLGEAVRVMAKLQLGKTLTDTQVNEIVEFLKSTTGEFPKITMPRIPETIGFSILDEG
jgi:cytochrome c peroxidase